MTLKPNRTSADRRTGRECGVTFLIFLVSVGVLEYLLRDVRRTSGSKPASPEIPKSYEIPDAYAAVSSETATTDLLSLGKALDAQKMGSSTISEAAPKEDAVR